MRVAVCCLGVRNGWALCVGMGLSHRFGGGGYLYGALTRPVGIGVGGRGVVPYSDRFGTARYVDQVGCYPSGGPEKHERSRCSSCCPSSEPTQSEHYGFRVSGDEFTGFVG